MVGKKEANNSASSMSALLISIVVLLLALYTPTGFTASTSFVLSGSGGLQSTWNDIVGNMSSGAPNAAYTLTITSQGPFEIPGIPTLYLTVPPSFVGSLTIVGTAAVPSLLVCSSNNLTGPAISFGASTAGWNLAIRNIQILNCSAISIGVGGTVSMDNVQFTGGLVTGSQSGLILKDNVHVTISNSVFEGYTCAVGTCNGQYGINFYYNLALAGNHANVIQNTHFLNNHLNRSTAVLVVSDDLELLQCEFSGNYAQNIIQIQARAGPSQQVTIANTHIHDNTATSGGIIEFGSTNQGNTTLSDGTVITNNIATGTAGVINIESSGATDYVTLAPNIFIGQNTIDSFLCTGGTIADPHGSNVCNKVCTGGQTFDRCYVCGGSSSCVGCDNVPFSGATCSAPVAQVTANNTGSNGTIATWPTGAPNPTLEPPGSTTQAMNITCGSISEVNGGTVVQSIDMTTMPWFVKEDTTANSYTRSFQYWSTDGSNTYALLEETLFGSSASIQSGDVTFTVGSNSLKMGLTVKNWPWKSKSNSLVVELSYELSEPEISQTSSQVAAGNGFFITNILVNTANTQVNINLQEFAVLDNTTQAITVNSVSGTSTGQTFQFIFPYFAQTLEYDPDFGVLLQNNAGSTTGGGDGGSSNTGLIAGLAGGLGGLALLVVIVVVLLAVLFGWWKVWRHDFVTKRRSTSMVNFDPVEEEDIEVSSSE